MRTLRIAQVCVTFPPYTGGTGNVCYHYARGLARLGFDVHVFTRSTKGAIPLEEREGFVVHRLRPLLMYGNAAYLPGLLMDLKGFDLIHLLYPFYGGETAALAARLQRVSLVITYHQDVLLRGLARVMEALVRASLEKAVLRSAAQVLFTSLDYYEHSHGRYLLLPRAGRLHELANGVDVTRFCLGGERAQAAPHFPWGGRPFIALLVAALDCAHSFKGVGVFMHCLGLLPQHVKAVIVGDGELRAYYERLAVREGVGGRTFFAGRVPDEELPGYYAAAGVTLLPSTTRGEAFGLVLLESLACGTPVIASNLPGVRTVVADGMDGFLVEPGNAGDLADKVLRLQADPALKQSMGERGRKKVVERYSWESIIPRLVEFYQLALAFR